MKKISIKEARAQFSNLIDLTEKGNEITITRHGKEVAKIVPIRKGKKKLPSLKEFRDKIKVKGKPLSQIVIQERQKERS